MLNDLAKFNQNYCIGLLGDILNKRDLPIEFYK